MHIQTYLIDTNEEYTYDTAQKSLNCCKFSALLKSHSGSAGYL